MYSPKSVLSTPFYTSTNLSILVLPLLFLLFKRVQKLQYFQEKVNDVQIQVDRRNYIIIYRMLLHETMSVVEDKQRKDKNSSNCQKKLKERKSNEDIEDRSNSDCEQSRIQACSHKTKVVFALHGV
mmetsp:Transcript_45928/g.74935  ORF Transcript_45928/g.74935 Transcript_45928/m.74935 type:complete len:126 (-) Transcript_45928:534-911(-)